MVAFLSCGFEQAKDAQARSILCPHRILQIFVDSLLQRHIARLSMRDARATAFPTGWREKPVDEILQTVSRQYFG